MLAEDRQRTLAAGIWIASFSAGAAVCPLIGGALLERLWWGYLFLVALSVMGLLLLTVTSDRPALGRSRPMGALLRRFGSSHGPAPIINDCRRPVRLAVATRSIASRSRCAVFALFRGTCP
jgi:MFS family permease